MKKSQFILFFSDGTCQSIHAGTMYQAVILLQASRIKYEKDFTIEVIKDENGNLFKIDSYMSFKQVDGVSMEI